MEVPTAIKALYDEAREFKGSIKEAREDFERRAVAACPVKVGDKMWFYRGVNYFYYQVDEVKASFSDGDVTLFIDGKKLKKNDEPGVQQVNYTILQAYFDNMFPHFEWSHLHFLEH